MSLTSSCIRGLIEQIRTIQAQPGSENEFQVNKALNDMQEVLLAAAAELDSLYADFARSQDELALVRAESKEWEIKARAMTCSFRLRTIDWYRALSERDLARRDYYSLSYENHAKLLAEAERLSRGE